MEHTTINTYYKYCIVPMCHNSSFKTPNKIFIRVPVDKNRRVKWLKACRRDVKDISEKNTAIHVCEDHFNLEEDMDNYVQFKLMGGTKKMKTNIVPHIFNCQPDRKRTFTYSPRAAAIKRAKRRIIDEAIASTSKTDLLEEQIVIDVSDNQNPESIPEVTREINLDIQAQKNVRPTVRNKAIQRKLHGGVTVALSPFKTFPEKDTVSSDKSTSLVRIAKCSESIKNMSMQLQSTSTVLSVSLEEPELLTAIKNEPPESEIGIDDIPNSLDEEIIPDVKEIDIVLHELSEDLIKSETVSENMSENNHSGSVETQFFVKTPNSLDEEIIPDVKEIDIVLHELSEDLVKSETVSENMSENNHSGSVETQFFVKTPNSLDEEIIPDVKEIDIVLHELSEDLIKSETVSENMFENNHSRSVETQFIVKTENIPLIKTENITQSEYLYKTQNSNDGNLSRGTSQGVIQVQGSNEHSKELQSDKQFVNFFKDLSDISRKAKCPNTTDFSECYKTVETTSCEKDKKKGKVIEVPVIPIEPHKYTSLTKESTDEQNKKSYCCEKCLYTCGQSADFKRHQLTHKTKAEIDDRLFKYRCDICKYKTWWSTSFKKHKLTHLKPEEIQYFYCYHCSYKSKHKFHLQIHILRHFEKGEVPFHCYICNFTTLKRNLIIEHFKKHLKHHSKCNETDYKNHLETYTKNQMRYCCEKCTYTSGKSSNFKLHQLTHKTKAEIDDQLLKYRCDKCKYRTYLCGNLKAHKLTHLKPEEIQYFYCYHCPYKCDRKDNLKIHIFNHFKKQEVPFHCYICDFTALKRNLIIEHLKKHPKDR